MAGAPQKPLKNYDHLFANIIPYFLGEANRLPLDYPPRLLWQKNIDEADFREKVRSAPSDIFKKTLGLYLNIPFCQHRCVFCCHASHLTVHKLNDYFAALLKEIDIYAQLLNKTPFKSVYLAGGTPSLLDENQLQELFDRLHAGLNLKKVVQFSFETGPATLNEEKIKILKKNGVDRLGLGVQSLDPAVLKINNRPQDTRQVKHIFDLARSHKIKFISLDLMMGIPGQTVESFMQDLKTLISWRPDVLHTNRFKPMITTVFSKTGNRLSAEDEQRIKEMDRLSKPLLKEHGYHATGGHQRSLDPAARNIQLSDAIQFNSSFIAIGGFANGHITGAYRYSNHGDVDAYIRSLQNGKLPIEKGYKLDTQKEIVHYLFTSLSMGKVSLRAIELLYGKSLSEYPQIIEKLKYLESRGKITLHDQFIKSNMASLEENTTYLQYLFCDDVLDNMLRLAEAEGIPLDRPQKD